MHGDAGGAGGGCGGAPPRPPCTRGQPRHENLIESVPEKSKIKEKRNSTRSTERSLQHRPASDGREQPRVVTLTA